MTERTATIPCPCPSKPHDSDTVTLREALGWEAAATAKNEVVLAQQEDPELPVGEILTILTRNYILHGIESWSLVDAQGNPQPVTRPAIRAALLADVSTAIRIGELADALYAEAVMLPLLREASNSSQPTPTDESTSPTTGSDSDPASATPSKPYSTTTSQMDDIETTSASPAGVSN